LAHIFSKPPKDWLTISFIWDKTPEGYDLWSEIDDEWMEILKEYNVSDNKKAAHNWEWLLLTIGCLYLGVSTTRAAIVDNHWLMIFSIIFFVLTIISAVKFLKN